MNTITLTFTHEHLYTITEGLMLMPFGKAAPVIASIQEQQRRAAQQAESPPPPTPPAPLQPLPEGADYQRHQDGTPGERLRRANLA